MQGGRRHQPRGWADDEQVTLPRDVGWTGLMTAHMRAIESARQDRLFDDPLATAVVDLVRNAVRTDPDVALPTGPEDDRGELTETWYMLSTFLGVRTPLLRQPGHGGLHRRHPPTGRPGGGTGRAGVPSGPARGHHCLRDRHRTRAAVQGERADARG